MSDNQLTIVERVAAALLNNVDVYLVGPSDSGKVIFAMREVRRHMQSRGYKVEYFADTAAAVAGFDEADICVVDSVGLMADAKTAKSKIAMARGAKTVASRVKAARVDHARLASIKKPLICIVHQPDIRAAIRVVDTVKKNEWNDRGVLCIPFGSLM